MDNHPPAEQDSEHTDTATPPTDIPNPLDPQAANPATAQQLTKVEQQMSGFEKATLRWAKSAVIMSALAAIFVCAQWYEMHEGGIDTHALAKAAGDQAQAAEDMATAAGDQVDAGNDFADSAEEINRGVSGAVTQLQAAARNAKASIDATKEAMRLDQRAWVGTESIGGIPLIPESDKAWDISIGLKNSGKTPAKNVLMYNIEHVLSAPPNVNSDCVEATSRLESKTILPPNLLIPVILHVLEGNKMPTDWEKKISDIGKLYVDGCVLYDDVFGSPHWMTYCGVFEVKNKGFLSCKTYNDTGDGKPPQ